MPPTETVPASSDHSGSRDGTEPPLARATALTTALRATAAHPDSSVFFFDFDGTLAPIHDDPEAVQPAPGIVDAISALATRVRRVTIVSARPVEFLRGRFPGVPLHLFGLYGLESQAVPGETVTYPAAAPYEDVIAELADRARADLPPDVLVEYKRLSVALHYRSAPGLRDEVHGWAQRQAQRYGLREQEGRMVIELKPSVRRDKGSVVAEEVEGFACAWYFGDDLGDLTAFRAIAERRDADPSFTGVRVAVGNPETGAEVAAAADLHFDGPPEVAAFLRDVVSAL
jgi:trehalose 6-phosphate phosphatase